ncbi:unnamed protein product [Linum tenue]|uniref:Syntaxin 6/10/61 N-terminal domain-containing protein n=1 Tax=Linum tenue TaxID=586396 RepID=A0AAV0MZG0_9ROSI|nr:unnamed protein product [Linum tenue]
MATSFDRWEKDPFFPAAEEVQESADRMESTYRTWVHAKKDSSTMWDAEELRRDLHTTLGTTKWQLEEFAKAVKSSYINSSTDGASERHRQFIIAIEHHISRVEASLKEFANSSGDASLPWVTLDEGERNELAAFLSGPSSMSGENAKEEMSYGHRRSVSAGADMSAWTIPIAVDGIQQDSFKAESQQPPRKIPSLSVIVSSIEAMPKLKWPKNGVRKWKAMDRYEESDSIPLHSSHLTRVKGINSCYEKSKSCLEGCDEYYDKPLYGWYGALQRQLQRSQYQMQYGRPIQSVLWIFILFCFIGLIALCAL